MQSNSDSPNRRAFLLGQIGKSSGAQTAASPSHCISSAVVAVLPGREEDVLRRLGSMPGVEVSARQERKLVLLLEGPGNGAVGSLLAEISVMEGVVSANMVFEHTDAVSWRSR